VPASLLLCDAEDRIVICNSVTQRYFPKVAHLLVPGMRFEDLVRAQAESGFLPEAVGNEEAWLAERLKNHRAADTTLTRQYEDGRWVQIIERRTSEGGIIGVRIDITPLKEREQALDEQAKRIAEHTKDLERSNRELEQFAYIASHDLQEPLRMVASYCQLLRRRYAGKLDQDADEFIEFAVEGASRMQRLINDLLGYSRIGRSNAGIVAFPAAQAVETALANLQATIEDTGARIEMGTLPAVTADPSQLAQLFQNLIGNAIKFRREEPLTVRVEGHAEPDAAADRPTVRFTVADNGIGIEPEYLERVFLIFQRLHERGKYPGTGIGLAIAKKVVDNHGGRIWIESTPGAGSRFHFTLPAAPAS
jgi:signal transduction histidine kinase